jgi:serine/threonine protein phosphatase 1
MAGRTIAIGDIHGCAAALECLLRAIKPQPADTIVTLGDYVDRGSHSREVIELLLDLRTQCRLVALKGNHELLMLRGLEQPTQMLHHWLQSGGLATLASYGGVEHIPDAHMEFLGACVDYYETGTHIFLHANYEAGLPLAQQPERMLFWEHLQFVLPGPHMSQKTAIVGHTPQRDGEVLHAGFLICIDTYCYGTGWLTAFDVDSGRTWQANKWGKLRS